VEEAQNRLENTWAPQEVEEEVMREARVLRGKGPLIYPGNPIPRHARARSQRCPASQICLGHRSDMSG
jgi:hypothetical protein